VRDAIALDARQIGRGRTEKLRGMARAFAPTRARCALAALSSLLLVLSFPDFNLWWLAWVGLVPLAVAVCAPPQPRGGAAFVLGWLAGALYFYGSCWWLTHSMIHYGGIPAFVAFPLLIPGALIVGLFPALWALTLVRVCARRGASRALLVSPFAWVAFEWARLYATGQLWNAVGYTQAYQPTLIQSASWGGVYAVGFLILTINSAISFALLRRDLRAGVTAAAAALAVSIVVASSARVTTWHGEGAPSAVVLAVQPNVTPNFERTQDETDALVARHLSMGAGALGEWDAQAGVRAASANRLESPNASEENPASNRATLPRVVVFPESPMNFSFGRDAGFRELVSRYAREERASVLFNSLEGAPAGGAYNSAVLVNEEGRLVAQYDKIRLLPFGEYVPLPRWLGGGMVRAIVGEFTPGARYTLLPVGDARAGVFICFESAFPAISREFTRAGADVLINISNDGYLGRTPVLRQHLANAVFRAVENQRPVLRVTNTGISARITPRGEVTDATASFEPATRAWTISRAAGGQTFYTRHGDLFVALCAVVTFLSVVSSQLSVAGRPHATTDEQAAS
jgi:apolipoprotein N-acyltransferase